MSKSTSIFNYFFLNSGFEIDVLIFKHGIA